MKLSKDVVKMRTHEQTLLETYKDYLTILETFTNFKTAKLTKDPKAVSNYDRLKVASITSFCSLLERHPHFNYRVNILQTIVSKLSSQHDQMRRICSTTVKGLLRKDDN